MIHGWARDVSDMSVAATAANLTRESSMGAHAMPGISTQASLRSTTGYDSDATTVADSDGEWKPRLTDFLGGAGKPMEAKSAGKIKLFSDGNGLCSPSR